MLFTSKMSLNECRQELKLSLMSNQIYGKVFENPLKNNECHFWITNRRHVLIDTRAPSPRLPIVVACSGKIVPAETGVNIQTKIIYGIAGSPIMLLSLLLIVFCITLGIGGKSGLSFEMTALYAVILTLVFSVFSALLSRLSNLGDEDQYELASFLGGNLKATQVEK